MDTKQLKKLLTPKQVADRLRASLGTPVDWRAQRIDPSPLHIGRNIRYREDDDLTTDEWRSIYSAARAHFRKLAPLKPRMISLLRKRMRQTFDLGVGGFQGQDPVSYWTTVFDAARIILDQRPTRWNEWHPCIYSVEWFDRRGNIRNLSERMVCIVDGSVDLDEYFDFDGVRDDSKVRRA